MEITIAQQTRLFLFSIGLGGILGVCYDLFRIIRIAFKHSALAAAVEDVAFALICTLSTFLFFLKVQYGEIRMFLLLGEAIGFILYYCTVGVAITGATKLIITFVKIILSFLYKIFISPILYIWRKLSSICTKTANFVARHTKKSIKKFDSYLKRPIKILYNQSSHLRVRKHGHFFDRRSAIYEKYKNTKE